ncbi:hypothetical protein IV203_007695 [Nitzschia inconspicua]|uniref:Transmembrane protein n=1 Tax=Nitzschia inconspicua TaxID=303405 RepID=A0A9K3KXA0_9STRA|nr:hypothetical protein IV203_007695 [Nitzschia inconspicua]
MKTPNTNNRKPLIGYGAIERKESDIEEHSDIVLGVVPEDDHIAQPTLRLPLNSTSPTRQHRRFFPSIVAVSSFLMVVVLVLNGRFDIFSGNAFLINSSATPGTPPGQNFQGQDWRSWALGVRDYWADKRQSWDEQKATLKAKNATKAEIKEAKAGFWNSTLSEFGGGGGGNPWAAKYSQYGSSSSDDDA